MLCKVHIFWDGQKIWSHKVPFKWPSQNISTLQWVFIGKKTIYFLAKIEQFCSLCYTLPPIRTVYINNAPLSRDFLRDWFKFELKIVSWLYWHITFKVAIVFFMYLKFHFSTVSKFAAFFMPNVFKSCWNQFVKQTFLEAMQGKVAGKKVV